MNSAYKVSYEVICPSCKRRFFVSGYVPRRVQCDWCGNGLEPTPFKKRSWKSLFKVFTKGSD